MSRADKVWFRMWFRLMHHGIDRPEVLQVSLRMRIEAVKVREVDPDLAEALLDYVNAQEALRQLIHKRAECRAQDVISRAAEPTGSASGGAASEMPAHLQG